MDEQFIDALKKNDLSALKKIPKSDLHNHGIFGGNISDVGKLAKKQLFYLPNKVTRLDEMSGWIMNQILPDLYSRNGFISLLESALKHAENDSIKILEMSVDSCLIDLFIENNMDDFFAEIIEIKNRVAPNVDLKPELGIKWNKNIDILHNRIDTYLESDFFKIIDLYGEEKSQPVHLFEKIYQKAQAKGLKLKAHIGEFGTPDDILEVIEKLKVNTIQHGIVAAKSNVVMKFLAEQQIQLNLCPTSNIMLSRVNSISEHPIRILYDNGIKVTINSDDMLIFGSSVSEEYLKLYNSGLMTAEELNKIRLIGLSN